MARAIAGVVLAQPLAQPVRLYANNGVGVLIEGVLPVEDVDRDRVLFNLIGLSGKGLLAQLGKQVAQRRRFAQKGGVQDCLQFSPFVLPRGRFCHDRRHPQPPCFACCAPSVSLYACCEIPVRTNGYLTYVTRFYPRIAVFLITAAKSFALREIVLHVHAPARD